MGGRGRCCCGCLIASDDFERGVSTDIGGLWTEVEGDWAVGDILGENATLDAVCKCNAAAPSENHVVYVDTIDEQEGDVFRVIVNYKDEDNYHHADFCCEAYDPEYGLVRFWELYKRTGGTSTLLKRERVYGATLDPPYRTGRTLFVCIGGNPDELGVVTDQALSASANYTVLGTTWADTTTITDGLYAGLGNGAETVIYYDNWYFYKHILDDPSCYTCTCYCDGNLWPMELSIRIYSPNPGRCAVDQTETLTYDRADATWKWSGTVTASDGSGRTADFEFILTCMSTMGDDIALSITSTGSCTASTPPTAVNYWIQKPQAGSTCNPIDLTYKITIPSSWLTCSLCTGGLPPPATDIYFYVTE